MFFRRSDVVATGDIFDPTRYPVIDLARGGSIGGEIDAINWLLDLLVPGEKEEGGTMVVPGHGRVCDESEVMEYRDMLTIVRDRVKAMVDKRMTLEQVKAAKPTFEYDPEYGASDAFVEAVFRGYAGAAVRARVFSRSAAWSAVACWCARCSPPSRWRHPQARRAAAAPAQVVNRRRLLARPRRWTSPATGFPSCRKTGDIA